MEKTESDFQTNSRATAEPRPARPARPTPCPNRTPRPMRPQRPSSGRGRGRGMVNR